MYGLLTTGKPSSSLTRTGKRKKAHHFELVIDTKKNEPKVKRDDEVEWDVATTAHASRSSSRRNYRGGQHSVDAYIRQISLANPHAEITYVPPKAEEHGAEHVFPRVTKEIPRRDRRDQAAPLRGRARRVLMQMFRDTKARNLRVVSDIATSAASRRAPAGQICEPGGVRQRAGPARSAATRPRRSTTRSRPRRSWRRRRIASHRSART